MANRRPALSLLNTFEAAGRLGSFKAAANELNVTPSAISHQIKTLEEQLNFSLFRRNHRTLSLTDPGKALLETVSLHLSGLKQGVDNVQRRYGHPSIRAHILPFQATEIVIPNLHHFQRDNPNVELRIETSLYGGDFNLSGIDIGIRLGTKALKDSWTGLEADLLLEIEVSPVCAPSLQANGNINTFSDLLGQNLIHIPYGDNPWQRWADAVGLKDLDTKEELTLDSYTSHLSAAEQGLGVSLGLFPLAYAWVKKGRLVELFHHRIPVEEAYYLIYRSEDAERPDLQAFRRWLHTLFSDLKKESDEFYSSQPHK